jgi:NAD dependent epimerase/dehydratase family enzyme
MPSILLFGVTGLVGSHLILALRDSYPDFPVTVYLRNKNIDDYLTKTAGVKRIAHGTYDEHAKIAALAEEHDIVINVGSSWDIGLTKAIIEGLKKRPQDKKTILLHMSGTGNFVETRWKDGSHHEGAKIWSVSDHLLLLKRRR